MPQPTHHHHHDNLTFIRVTKRYHDYTPVNIETPWSYPQQHQGIMAIPPPTSRHHDYTRTNPPPPLRHHALLPEYQKGIMTIPPKTSKHHDHAPRNTRTWSYPQQHQDIMAIPHKYQKITNINRPMPRRLDRTPYNTKTSGLYRKQYKDMTIPITTLMHKDFTPNNTKTWPYPQQH